MQDKLMTAAALVAALVLFAEIVTHFPLAGVRAVTHAVETSTPGGR